MHAFTHLLTSWAIAEAAPLRMRERAVVVLCGVAPDLDGLGVVAEIATRGSEHPVYWWTDYHHVLCHNIGFGLALAAFAAIAAPRGRRLAAAGLGLLAFHVHLAADLVGGRSPSGFQWPIPYLLPFSDRWQWTWRGQWALNAWPNLALTAALLALTLFLAWRRGYSPVGIVSTKADAAFVRVLRKWFGAPTRVRCQEG